MGFWHTCLKVGMISHGCACRSRLCRLPAGTLLNKRSLRRQRLYTSVDSAAHTEPLHHAERQVREIPLMEIRRPLGRTRTNDQEKVKALAKSIQEIGLQEPIDVLEVDGKIYGFSGCHRYEAHQQLGVETIRCRVRKASQQTLKMHLM